MKSIAEAAVGGDGVKVGLAIDGEDLALTVKMPAKKVLEPVMSGIDQTLDKIEALIPGDQKREAELLKAELHSRILAIFTEQVQPVQAAATLNKLESQVASVDKVEDTSNETGNL